MYGRICAVLILNSRGVSAMQNGLSLGWENQFDRGWLLDGKRVQVDFFGSETQGGQPLVVATLEGIETKLYDILAPERTYGMSFALFSSIYRRGLYGILVIALTVLMMEVFGTVWFAALIVGVVAALPTLMIGYMLYYGLRQHLVLRRVERFLKEHVAAPRAEAILLGLMRAHDPDVRDFAQFVYQERPIPV